MFKCWYIILYEFTGIRLHNCKLFVHCTQTFLIKISTLPVNYKQKNTLTFVKVFYNFVGRTTFGLFHR